jgi:hypothetical protein
MKEIMMKEVTKEMILEKWHTTNIYNITMMFIFYVLPLCISDIVSGYIVVFMITPALCFILSMIQGLHHRDKLFHSIIILLLYFPSTFIYYNPSMMLVGFGYSILSSMGLYLGESISLVTTYLYRKKAD